MALADEHRKYCFFPAHPARIMPCSITTLARKTLQCRVLTHHSGSLPPTGKPAYPPALSRFSYLIFLPAFPDCRSWQKLMPAINAVSKPCLFAGPCPACRTIPPLLWSFFFRRWQFQVLNNLQRFVLFVLHFPGVFGSSIGYFLTIGVYPLVLIV